ncbi:histidine triad nucleotide-binding protein [Candidatus Peregrinibacteria bacterium]|jgi:histidine triad (HIT) family protein|nr:histidine triad nucleotide-binding protein [Candidatus Peregrinibacteria bacterium]MBT7484382.1 histidine triad nucleotide-binding protein [Candidatus Peregrinibacteria bacterium]MBT7703795.1 histidine triad nucleotide-binding protein [Candidatus Peregrinibacteria bacterium]
MSNDCIFCKIIEGVIPSNQIHSDDLCVAFPDINPKTKVHILIVPTKHIPTIKDLGHEDEKLMGHLIGVARDIAKKENLEGYKLQFNVGEKGGQEVFHIHLHLMGN